MNRIYFNDADIDRSAILKAPLRSQYDTLIAAANKALTLVPRSVVDTIPNPPPEDAGFTDKHLYYTAKPYWWFENGKWVVKDGQINPNQDRSDYQSAMAMCRAIRDLGLAFHFTGDVKYKTKAHQLIAHWCVNSSTRMHPRFTNQQSRIELCITIPGLLYGAALTDYTHSVFTNWVDSFSVAATKWRSTNNYDLWRLVLVMASASLLNDNSLRDQAVIHFNENCTKMIDGSGKLPAEYSRTKSLFYSTYALNAMVQVAEIARLLGVNLYNAHLKRALDYHAPHVVNPATWPGQQIDAYKGENAALYQLANRIWPGEYDAVCQRWPMYEERIVGPVLLTHSSPIVAGPTAEEIAYARGVTDGKQQMKDAVLQTIRGLS